MGGVVTIPYSFFNKDIRNSTKKHLSIISRSGLCFGVLGGIGYMGVGIFSLQRAGPSGIFHTISAIIAFIGFVFSIIPI